MKKLFIFVLLLPLLVLAEEPFPAGRVSDTRPDGNALSGTKEDSLAGAAATAKGLNSKEVCPMCTDNVLLGANTNADRSSANVPKPTESGTVRQGQ